MTSPAAANEIRYSMLFQWSQADNAYLVALPEWEGRVFNPVIHGATYEDAAWQGLEVLQSIIAIALERGDPLPGPSVIRQLAVV